MQRTVNGICRNNIVLIGIGTVSYTLLDECTVNIFNMKFSNNVKEKLQIERINKSFCS